MTLVLSRRYSATGSQREAPSAERPPGWKRSPVSTATVRRCSPGQGEFLEVAFAGGLVDGGDPEVAVVEVDALGVVGVALQGDGAYQGEIRGVGCGQGAKPRTRAAGTNRMIKG